MFPFKTFLWTVALLIATVFFSAAAPARSISGSGDPLRQELDDLELRLERRSLQVALKLADGEPVRRKGFDDEIEGFRRLVEDLESRLRRDGATPFLPRLRRLEDRVFNLARAAEGEPATAADLAALGNLARETPRDALHQGSGDDDCEGGASLGGAIEGTVVDAATGEALAFVEISAQTVGGYRAATATTGLEGTYCIDRLAVGSYRVSVREGRGYLREAYPDLPCISSCVDEGTPLAVRLGEVTGGVDFALDYLEAFGRIAGTVVDAETAEPLAADVFLFDGAGRRLAGARARGGVFEIEGLPPGTYYARAHAPDKAPYLDQLHGGIDCTRGVCDPTLGRPIVVSLRRATASVDFALVRGGGLAGRVTHAFDGRPVDDLRLELWSERGERLAGTRPDAAGRYAFDRLGPGRYFVTTRSGSRYHDEAYEDLPCPGGAPAGCDPTAGSAVAVDAGEATPGVDFALERAAPDCRPSRATLCLAGGRFRVEAAWEDDGEVGAAVAEPLTDAAGVFRFDAPGHVELAVKVLDACRPPFERFWLFAGGLTDRRVELTATDTLTGVTRTYGNPRGGAFEPVRDLDAFATCAAGRGRLEPGTGRRMAMRAPLPDRRFTPAGTRGAIPAEEVRVSGGRFVVEAEWRAPDGRTGRARGRRLGTNAAQFWFFEPDNVELVVKVLDACNVEPFRNRWVFAAGLTDLEVTVRVTDVHTGEVREYLNPQGVPFAPIRDTSAFASCR